MTTEDGITLEFGVLTQRPGDSRQSIPEEHEVRMLFRVMALASVFSVTMRTSNDSDRRLSRFQLWRMIMRKSPLAAFFFLTGILLLMGGRPVGAIDEGPAYDETFSVDAVHSSVLFRVTHMGVGPFWGRFGTIKGAVEIAKDGDDLKLDLQVAIDSVDTGSSKLDQHLQTEDFFHASEYPSATFKSRSARKTSDGTFRVSGDLTIRGVTEAVDVDVSLAGPVDTRRGRRCGIETEFVLKRADFGMTYGAQGGMVGDEVRLIVALEAVAEQGGTEETGREGRRPGRGMGARDPKMMMERIKAMDKDGNGKIERSEVSERMRNMFKRLDANGDGVADKKEIKAFQKRMRSRANRND